MLKLKYTKSSPVKVLSAVIEERKRIYVQGKRYLIISEIWIFRIGRDFSHERGIGKYYAIRNTPPMGKKRKKLRIGKI
jgi:hypothetical protein